MLKLNLSMRVFIYHDD